MRVALFHDFLVRMGGAEKVLHTFSELFPDSPIYTFFYDKEKVEREYPGLSARIIPHPGAQRMYNIIKHIPIVKKYSTKIFIRSFPKYIEEINVNAYELVIASSTAWAHGLITGSNTSFVCYMHSPMRFVWDWFNEYKKSLGAVKNKSFRNIILTHVLSSVRMWDQVALKKESLILTNAKTVQKRVEKYYHRFDSHVLYPPVEVELIQAPKSSDIDHEDYFLIVSNLVEFKRIDIAIELFNKTGKKLVILGDGPHRDQLESRAAKNIEFLGYKNDEVKFEYLKNARALILSTEEDFGIVPIEAHAAGKPVLALAKGGAREYIIPGVNGEFFYEQTLESMEKGLAHLLMNEDKYNALTIRSHAEKFSTQNFIKNFKHILKTELGIEITQNK
ncbi:MAG: glycosyltransferase [Candidatus Gracilibacteria bacterium]